MNEDRRGRRGSMPAALPVVLDGGGTLVRRREHLLHGALHRHYPIAHTGSTGRASSPTSRPAARSAVTGRRAALRARGASSTRIAERLLVNPADLRLRHWCRRQPDRELSSDWVDGLGPCIEKVVASALPERHGACRRQGIGIACSSYICGAGLPIYWNACRTPASDQARPGGGVPSSAASRHRAGLRHSWPSSWPSPRIDPLDIRLCGPTPT